MAQELPKSRFGEGVGGPVATTRTPDDPSYDPASRLTGTDQKIAELLKPENATNLTAWEIQFLGNCYGQARLSRSQHIRVGKIFGRVFPKSPASERI